MSDTGAALAAALRSADAAERRRTVAHLASLDPATGVGLVDADVARALLIPLASAHRTEQREAADAIARLVLHSAELREVVRAALGSEVARLRWGAAYALGRALPASRELWPAARETLALDDGDQRWAAAKLACAIARNDATVRDELHAALGDAAPTLRKMVLYCLRDLGDRDAVPAARRLLADPDAGVRLAALAILGRPAARGDAGSDAAAAEVAAMLAQDPDLGVRRAAAATLGKLGSTGAQVLQALREAAAAADPSLARAAQGALRALSAPG